MRPVRPSAIALLGFLFLAVPAHATWIQGKVLCDDGDGVVDSGDTPINGVVVKAVSQDVSPGTTYTDTTGDAIPVSPAVAGFYRIMLPHNTDTYVVMIQSGMPPGSDFLIPASGQHTVGIISGSGDPSNAQKTKNFLLHDCPAATTTTSTTKTTTSTSTSSTSSTTSTSSTSSSSTSTSSTSTSTSSTSTSSTSSSSTTVTSTTSTTRVTTPLEFCEETVDHLKCYRTRRGTPFRPNGVSLVDQFETADMTVLRPYRLCNPVDKNDEGIVDSTEHQMCYQVRDTVVGPRFRRREVIVENQFGTQTLVVTRPETLCVPAEKDMIVSDLNGDPMKCYRVNQKFGQRDFVPINVDLEDQFEVKETTVLKPVLLCNPTAVDGDPITSPTCHQVCYKIVDVAGQPDFIPVPVTVDDAFSEGTGSINPFRGECRQVSLLCVPSLKTDVR